MTYIKNKYGGIIYCIRPDGEITDRWDVSTVGHLKEDRITDKFDIETLYHIRPDGTVTDKYDVEIVGHIDRSLINRMTSNSDGIGFLETILNILGIILLLIFKALKLVFKYALVPRMCEFTVYFFLSLIICASFTIIWMWVVTCIVVYLLEILFIPFLVKLIVRRTKKIITVKEYYILLFWWFITGPYAYVKLGRIDKERLPKAK